MDHRDRELLTRDMVTGYRTYARPADLEVVATTEAMATSWPCVLASVVNVLQAFRVGNQLSYGPGPVKEKGS